MMKNGNSFPAQTKKKRATDLVALFILSMVHFRNVAFEVVTSHMV